MNDVFQFVMVCAAGWSLFAFVGAYVAQAKGRPAFEGVVFGFMLGPIGLVLTAMLPTVRKAEPQAGPAPKANPDDLKTAPRPRRRIGGPGDDVAMDFVMDLIRRGEAEAEPGPSRSMRRPS